MKYIASKISFKFPFEKQKPIFELWKSIKILFSPISASRSE